MAPRTNAVDHDAATELNLFIENESSLYNQKKSIIENIKRRMRNGSYDPALAPKLWIYWVDNGARLYCKENKCTMGDTFNPATRAYVAGEMARHYELEIKAMLKKASSIPDFTLNKIPLNRQGYTSSGQYYGVGKPLYVAQNSENNEVLVFRAQDRPAAMGMVKFVFTNPERASMYFSHGDMKRFREGR